MELRVLGPLELWAARGLVELGGPRQRRLLAILLVESPRVVSSADIVERLWPAGEQPPKADAALRTYLSRLRRALSDAGVSGELIRTDPPGYRLDANGWVLDAQRFEALVEESRRLRERGDAAAASERVEQARRLWRGRPYAEFADEPWAAPEVQRLEELHLTAAEERLQALLALGQHQRAVPEIERLAADHPLRESLVGLRMLALHRGGRSSDALRAYESYRRMLAECTGLEPGAELARLGARVLAQDPLLLLLEPAGVPLRGYRLGRQLGEGAFAHVFEATQPSVGRAVAVKVIRAELANRPEFIRRFEAEAQLVAHLEHPHIVPLYDYWREPDRACLVMRLLRGGTLEQRLSSRGPLSLQETATLASQVGAGLAAAHRARVVHRDVKPANVFLDDDGNFYLGDFGIALDAASVNDPESALSAGSPAYASPEQLLRKPVGPGADVHGLAITLFEALTARLPFPDAANQAELLQRQLHDPIPLVGHLRADIPTGIDEVLQRATAKDPAARFAHIDAFVNAFNAALRLEPSAGATGAPRPGLGVATALGAAASNPYKGLRPFSEADAADFAGRDRLVDQFLDRLRRAGSAGRLLTVVGPSGSGKSSAVRAGLLPALRRGAVDGSDRWFLASMTPGRDPFEELLPALLKVAPSAPQQLGPMLGEDHRGITRAIKAVVPEGGELLLVIDQFEELFTLTIDEQIRRRFLDAVEHALADQRCPLRVVLTLRADFYDRPLRYGAFARLVRDSTVLVVPLAADELERAIVDPAARAGASFEPGLVSRLVADVADQPAALPLLQYALTELFDQRVSTMLTVAAYEHLGGLAGALAARAEQLATGGTLEEQQATRRLFTRLVALGEGSEDTRRRVLRSELGGEDAMTTAIERFGAARLVSFDRDPATREPTVEVAHEALIRQWPRLRGWLEEDRDGLRLHRQLTDAAQGWTGRGRDSGELFRGARLDATAEWAAAGGDADLNADERAFLDASRQLRNDERTRLQRSNRRLRGSLMLVAMALALALVAGAIAVVQQNRATANAEEAGRQRDQAAVESQRAEGAARAAEAARAASDVRRLVAESKVAQSKNFSLSMLLAVEAHRQEESPATLGALQSALVANPRVLQVQPAQWGGAEASGAMNGDGSSIIVGRADGRVELFDAATLQRKGEPLVASNNGSWVSVAAGSDPTVFVSADLAGTLIFWDLPTGTARAQRQLSGATRTTSQPLAMSRQANRSIRCRRWRDVGGGRPGPGRRADPSADHRLGRTVQRLAVSPDGTRLAIATTDMIITVVESASGATVQRIATGLTGATIGSLAWSPDGTRLAQGNGGTIGRLGAIFDASSGQQLSPYLTDTSTPIGGYVAGGSIYANGSSNGFVQLRHPSTGGVLEAAVPTFVGIGRSVLSSADGATLYVLGGGGLCVISLDGRRKLATPLPFPYVTRGTGGPFAFDFRTGRVDLLDDQLRSRATFTAPDFRTDQLLSPSFDLSADGTAFAAGSANGTISVIDVASGTVRLAFAVPFSEPDSKYFATYGPAARTWVGFVRWSPDGTALAVGRWDRVYLFHATTGVLRREIVAGWKDQLTSLSFSPDGRMLAVGSFDGTGMVVDVATGTVIGEPFGKGNFAVAQMAWTPDGKGIVAVDNLAKTITTLDLYTRQALSPTIANFVSNLAFPWFDDSGTRLLAFGTDGYIRTFDVASGVEIGDGFGPGTLSLASSAGANGTLVTTVTTNPTVSSLWDSDPAHWEAKACAAAGRNLTEEEWTRYLPNSGPRRVTCERWPIQT